MEANEIQEILKTIVFRPANLNNKQLINQFF